jgi:tetratricopeptide (TPR) repeat protein
MTAVQSLRAQTIADGLRCLENEQYSRAGQIFRSLVAAQPTASHCYYLGHFYMNLERADSAQGIYADSAKLMFEKGIQADPKFNLNYVGLGTWEIFKERPGQGKILIDKAVQSSRGKDGELLYRAAEAWVIYPNPDALEANRLLDMAIKVNKNNPDYYNLKGDAFMLKNDGSAAATNYDKAKQIAPNSAKGYINYGNILIRAKSYQKALESYLEGMTKDSLYATGYRQLGELYFKAGKYDKAVESYSRYVKMSDQRPESQYRFGAFLFLAKDYDKALEVLNILPESYKNAYRYRLLAYCLAEKQQPVDGLARMEQFLQSTDSNKIMANDQFYYGRLLIESGKDTIRGLSVLKKSALKDSSKYASITDFGKKFFTARRYAYASEAYQMVIDGGSKNNQDYFNLANAYYYGKDFVKADTIVSRLLRAQPQSTNANLLKARCINQQKLDPDQSKGLAKPYYEKYTLLITPENVEKLKKQLLECYLYLGGYYAVKNDVPQAHAAWRKVLELDPENKKAKDGLLIK